MNILLYTHTTEQIEEKEEGKMPLSLRESGCYFISLYLILRFSSLFILHHLDPYIVLRIWILILPSSPTFFSMCRSCPSSSTRLPFFSLKNSSCPRSFCCRPFDNSVPRQNGALPEWRGKKRERFMCFLYVRRRRLFVRVSHTPDSSRKHSRRKKCKWC